MNNNAMMIKTKCLFGKRLKSEDYQALIQKKEIPQIAAYLKNETYYRQSLEGINESGIHRGQLEHLIRLDVFKRFPRILKYAARKDDDFSTFLVIHTEITQILDTVKSLMYEDKTNLIARMPIFLTDHTSFDLKKLAEVHNYDDLIRLLQKTKYHSTIEKFQSEKLSDIDFVGLEYELIAIYYQETLALARRNFKGLELKAIEDMIVSEIELDNLAKIYRLKRYFNASAQTIKSYLFPMYRYFSKKQLEQIIQEPNAEDVITSLRKSKYGYYMGDSQNETFEYYQNRIKYEISKHYMYFSNSPEVVLLAYFELVDIEIRNIVDIIEGARYHIPVEQVSRLLTY